MKDIITLILYQLVYYIVKCVPAKVRPNNLLLIKTDEIGDYMLFRNMLHHFKRSQTYKEHTITLIGNSIFKQIFEARDSNTVNNVIWLNKKKFRNNLLYRFKILRDIRKSGYSDVVSLIYSRNFRIDDAMAAVSAAPNKTAMSDWIFYRSAFEKMLNPAHIYHRIIKEEDENLFEAYRNARFTEQLLKIKINEVSTAITVQEDIHSLNLPAAYFVVFPGSGLKEKKWSAANFAMVSRHIINKYSIVPVVCGSSADIPDAQDFISRLNAPVTDLTGKTTLPVFLAILKNASCLISVDTGSVHLAAAVQCPVFALFSGIHYGRFAPYPTNMAPHFYPIYPDAAEEKINAHEFEALKYTAPDLLRTIPVEKMIAAVDQYLPLILGKNDETLTKGPKN